MELSLMDKQLIEKQVESLLDGYGYFSENSTYVDIVKFAKHFGFLVGNTDIAEKDDGFLYINPEKKKMIIGVNSNRPIELKRFIVAHEFAHYILHYQQGVAYLHRINEKGKGPDEQDADYFAAALLMPKASFTKEYTNLKQDDLLENTILVRLSSIFKTPIESVSRRIAEVITEVIA